MGDKVYICHFTGFLAWLPGTIVEETRPVSFRVQLLSGRIHWRHVHHIHIRYSAEDTVSNASSAVGPGVPA